MKYYKYKGFLGGKKDKGVICADSLYSAKETLKNNKILVIDLLEVEAKSITQKMNSSEILNFTVQLSQLLGAGMPVYESLMSLEEQYQGEKFFYIISDIRERVKLGASLSEALKSHAHSFSPLYLAMVESGEASGSLPLILKRLTSFLKASEKVKKNVLSAMIYPSILIFFTFLVILLLLFFVVPTIEEIFEGRHVNTYTSLVLSISHFLKGYWFIYFPFFLFLGLFIGYKLKSNEGKELRDNILLRIPIVSKLVIHSSLARFFKTMATLQRGGINIVDALQYASKVVKNRVLEREIGVIENNLIEGGTFSTELLKTTFFPKIVSKMIKVGEESGDVILMYEQIAEIYEEEVEKNVSRIMTMSQPVILLVLGVIIGAVLLAVMLPFTDISSLTVG